MTRAIAVCAFAALGGCLDGPPRGDAPAVDAGRKTGDASADAAAPGLILRYLMDEVRTGGVVEDVVGARDADCDACPAVEEGAVGGSLDFSGGDHLVVRKHEELQPPAGTIAVWVWLDSSSDCAIVTRPIPGGNYDDFALFVFEDRFSFHAGSSPLVVSAPGVPLGGWVHLAATWSPERHSLHVDGVMVDELLSPGPWAYESDALLIGRDRDNGTLVFALDGRLDDLRLYDRPLSDAEIAALAAPADTTFAR